MTKESLQQVLRINYDREDDKRIVCTLDFYDHHEIYHGGTYRDFRGYIVTMWSEKVIQREGYTVSQFETGKDWRMRMVLHEMPKGRRRTPKLDKTMIDGFMLCIHEEGIPYGRSPA